MPGGFSGPETGWEDGLRLGIYNKAVPAEKLMEETMALARRIVEKPPNAMRRLKQNMNYAVLQPDFHDALDREGLRQRFRRDERAVGVVRQRRQRLELADVERHRAISICARSATFPLELAAARFTYLYPGDEPPCVSLLVCV